DISSPEEPICGGEAKILIDACPENHAEVFKSIRESLEYRQPGVLATFIQRDSDEKVSIKRHWLQIKESSVIDSEIPYAGFYQEIKRSFKENQPDLLELNEKTSLFLEPIYPLPHLVIAGAGHIGKAVCHLGSLLDFEVTVIDDRPEYADKEKLPEADNIIVDHIEKGMQAIPKSSDTYIVIVTRGHKNDADALRQCIHSEVAYIGMIGSKRKIKLMQESSLKEGWATPEQWDPVYAPIGIEIQSKTVQEIAVSIAAQLVLMRRQKQNKKDVIWSGP
ncbi:hypothetical protein FJZ33_13155, partial [Candidatus Poribacteria bacterium]|nr:hypothetical protein [Candidatus Poribacteria bacterium]